MSEEYPGYDEDEIAEWGECPCSQPGYPHAPTFHDVKEK